MVLAFTLPKAYELKKDEVDSLAAKAHHHGKVRVCAVWPPLSCNSFEPPTKWRACAQANYTKYVEPYVNKIPRASTSTSTSTAAPTKPTMVDSTAESMPPILSEPKKVI